MSRSRSSSSTSCGNPPPSASKRRRRSLSESKPRCKPSRPAYGSSYSWDAAQGQAFLERIVTQRGYGSPPKLLEAPPPNHSPNHSSSSSSSSAYMGLIQLFNQFQGMPVDTRKVLVTVTVLGSTGPLRMLVTSHTTVKDLIKASLLRYAHEGRVPALGRDPARFLLCSSQFSPQALGHEDKVACAGTRNFVLCFMDPIQSNSTCNSNSSNSNSNSNSSSSSSSNSSSSSSCGVMRSASIVTSPVTTTAPSMAPTKAWWSYVVPAIKSLV